MDKTADNKQRLLELIDSMTAPPMAKEEALEFLDELITELDMRCDGLRDEMREDGDDEDE